MEENAGVTVIGAETPSTYQMAPRIENANHIGSVSKAVDVSPVSVGLTSSIKKKKRGRPRKYGPEGTMTRALSPMPISSSAPPCGGEFSNSGKKRGRGRGSDYHIKHMENLGEWAASSNVGANFMLHVITVNAGEDVTMKVISFSQQKPRAICIISANGVISNVTLRQPDSSGGTVTNEGRFEILSLSGSFMPTETQGTRSRSGGMSVSLASADGRVVGGGVAGLLIAASAVQVVVGSFLRGNQNDQKHKKQKIEFIRAAPNSSIVVAPASNGEKEDGIDVASPQQNSNALKPNLNTATFQSQRENWVTAMQGARNSATDINISLPAA
ncbi:AT-hook motif nuclear-localized protein 2 [Hibiscus syriacus]|uniref:AT-hook motif nuclear-localized protein n=1 Tax=Hibiscus syriacus TaxID=106335 RepID=A0A6A3A982_HIBSY|nr:AT-hook motif nuclear-localized protein 1-like [Hibiscus syriacus]XP_039005496.1 AT-hook motif nuclear-localized protein 1-like [Hibiscus syriacus]KAE8699725.1 AT-hook motif nuclear-localized protein 2 [Hibiscus syriacus]